MTRLALLLGGLALAALPLAAQQAAPAFEVASVKKQAAQIIPSGPPSAAPALSATFRRGNASIVTLVRIAYNVTDAEIVGGPDWARKDLFEINARAAGAASLDEMRPMVAALLAERFKLIVHREQKTMRGAVLEMAREDRRPGPERRSKRATSTTHACPCSAWRLPAFGVVPTHRVPCRGGLEHHASSGDGSDWSRRIVVLPYVLCWLPRTEPSGRWG